MGAGPSGTPGPFSVPVSGSSPRQPCGCSSCLGYGSRLTDEHGPGTSGGFTQEKNSFFLQSLLDKSGGCQRLRLLSKNRQG